MKTSNTKYGKRGHVTYYKDKMPTHNRITAEIKKVSDDGRCWWIEQYLRSSMVGKKRKPR